MGPEAGSAPDAWRQRYSVGSGCEPAPGGVSRTHPVEVIPAGFGLEAAMHRRDNDASDQLIDPAGSLA